MPPGVVAVRTYVADDACVTYRFELEDDVDASSSVALDQALSFQPRGELVAAVDRRSGGLTLCGAQAPPCVGGVP